MSFDTRKGGCVCYHLIEDDGLDKYRQFTGLGNAYNLFCNQCWANQAELEANLRQVSPEKFEDVDGYGSCEGFIGEAEVLQRPSDLKFIHALHWLRKPLPSSILSIQPEHNVTTSTWIAILASREVVRIELDKGTFNRLCVIKSSSINFSEKIAVHLSPDNQLLAIVNERGSLGIVVDLSTGKPMMELNRGKYYPAQTPFPVAFFQVSDEIFLVHGTNWNRLDISNPRTGKLLTERAYVPSNEANTRPEHYLDYFHGFPVISPDAKWIIEDGWIWMPYGVTRLWNLQRWLTQNVWESEDGVSLKWFNWRLYFWDVPLCWTNNQTIAVWGFGDGDDTMIPAVQLFDAESGKLLRWFAGPKQGALYFDTYLFSTSNEGTDVWDIETGERLLHDPDLKPAVYHPHKHQFLTILPDATFRLSYWI